MTKALIPIAPIAEVVWEDASSDHLSDWETESGIEKGYVRVIMRHSGYLVTRNSKWVITAASALQHENGKEMLYKDLFAVPTSTVLKVTVVAGRTRLGRDK